jgi:DNA (cytosine-5)-methyltransferase 1
MTLLPDRILSGEVEAPDLFCGGTPCQAFSVAGLRNSLDDARGNLSLTFVGIANAIDHVRSVRRDAPAIIFWENVPGVLNTKDNAFGCFLGALAGETEQIVPPGDKWTNSGCVFGPQRTVAWRVLDAQYFGVAQRRRRVFVVASAREDFDPTEVLFEFEGLRRDIAPSRQARKVTPTISSSGTGVSRVGFNCEDEWFIETPVVGALDTECGGNKMNHQTINSGHLLPVSSFYESSLAQYREANVSGTIKASGGVAGGGSETFLAQPIPLNTMNLLGREVENHRRGFGIGEAGDPSPTLTKNHSHAVAHPIAFSADLSQKAEGIGYKEELAPCLAVGTHPGHGAHVHTVMETVAPTLTASNDPSRSPQSTEVTNQVAAVHSVSMAVRRLTPTECERLQGFPDGYTNIPWRKASEAPDGPRYKALGNSWAVPVVRWIGKRIQERITT